ncbi:transposase, partial [Streptomyces sp. PRKS01-29]
MTGVAEVSVVTSESVEPAEKKRSGEQVAGSRRGARQPLLDRKLVAELVGQARGAGVSIDGEGGLLAELTKLVVESALEGELTDHLGYDKHERGGSSDGNARNGSRSKTVLTKAG